MREYAFKRILQLIPLLFVVSVLIFIMMRLIPGDITAFVLGDQATAENAAALRRMLGLDQPLYIQYFAWLSHVLRGDFGNSFVTNRPVADEINRALPVTVELAALTILLSVIGAIPLGLISAVRQGSLWDIIARVLAVVGMSVPYFWIGTMILIFGAIYFNWIPEPLFVSPLEDPLTNITQIGIAAIVNCYMQIGIIARMVRSAMLEVLCQDYIRTAWAKGLRERIVVMRHASKNAMIPVITVIGNQMVVLLGGLVVTETIFTLPGVGRLMFTAVGFRDYTVVQGVVLLSALVAVAVNLAVDLTYGFFDPRVRYK